MARTGFLLLVLGPGCSRSTAGPESSTTAAPREAVTRTTLPELSLEDEVRLYALAFRSWCESGGCALGPTIYIQKGLIDSCTGYPGEGDLSEAAQQAIQAALEPFGVAVEFLETEDAHELIDSPEEILVLVPGPIERLLPEVVAIDLGGFTDREAGHGSQLIFRWNGTTWEPITPEEVGLPGCEWVT